MTDQTRQAIIDAVLRDLNIEARTLAHEIVRALREAREIEQKIRCFSGDNLAELDRHKAATKRIDEWIDGVRQRCRHPATTQHSSYIHVWAHRTCDVCGAELPA